MEQQDVSLIYADLIIKHLKNELTEEERSVLLAWCNLNDNNQRLFEELTTQDRQLPDLHFLNDIAVDQARDKILSKIKRRKKVVFINTGKKALRFAALLIIALSLYGLYWYVVENSNKPQPTKPLVAQVEITPGSDKAVLTLSDGTVVVLDSTANGKQLKQGDVSIVNSDGKVQYKSVGESKEVAFNTIHTPNGGQYMLELSDGTKVWLNAASSIYYPTFFNGNERRVEITGEAYFEVAKDTKKPFKVVVSGKTEIQVLGTHFNINAYADESAINTTLLEGKIKMTALASGLSNTLAPGQQGQLSLNNELSVKQDINTEEVIAWKEGKFLFNSSSIQNIMRQISRWYDVNVIYQGKISQETFSGIVSRKSNLLQVLKILEEGGVYFKIKDKTIIIF